YKLRVERDSLPRNERGFKGGRRSPPLLKTLRASVIHSCEPAGRLGRPTQRPHPQATGSARAEFTSASARGAQRSRPGRTTGNEQNASRIHFGEREGV